MSVSGISLTNYYAGNQNVQSKSYQIQQEFQQLGQDISSGNISAAESDFGTMQQLLPNQNANSTSQLPDPLIQDFQQLGQNLQSGDTSAAQNEYSNIQNNVQSGTQHTHFHHRYHVGSGGSGSGGTSQLLEQLGQSLQSGDATAAQQSFTSLQQDLQSSLASSLSVSA